MNNNTEIEPNWNIIKLNERDYWSPDVLEATTANYGVYAFDRNAQTFCCEATPSYCLYRIGTELHAVEGMSEDDREQLNEYEINADAGADDIIYMHVSDVESLIGESPDLLQHVDMDEENVADDEDPVDNIREGWCTGALIY